MKHLIMLSFLLVGCNSVSVKNTARSSGEDVLKNESMLRYGQERLEKISESETHLLQSVAYCYRGKISKGLEHLKAKYKEAKSKASYWNQIGTCYFLDNKIGKARLFFQKALQTSRNHHSYAPAYNNLGLVYLKEKQYELSLSSFEQAIKAKPGLLTPLFNLGHLYLKFGNAKDAEKIFRRLYTKNKKDIDVISALGSLALTKGRYKDAIRLYKTISKSDLKRPDIALNYAMALTQTKKTLEAKEVLATAENHKDWRKYRRSIEKLLE